MNKNNQLKGLEYLSARKAELRIAIDRQKKEITTSGQEFFSFRTLSVYVLNRIVKTMTLTDGVRFGYRALRLIDRIFRKK